MLDEKKARRVIRFIECLKHTKGEFHGEPFKLLPWQEKIIRDVFGTVRDDDPTMRKYNTAYIEIPKKNGKSELGAAIALNMLINDDEQRAGRCTPARPTVNRPRLCLTLQPIWSDRIGRCQRSSRSFHLQRE